MRDTSASKVLGLPGPHRPSRDALPANPFRARSWLEFGDPIEEPEKGALAVIWRGSPSGPSGHVAFHNSEYENGIEVIGGNQSNAVTLTRIAKTRLLGYRSLSAAED
jgi:uncharacterized protein (TIGR02594 family)